MKNNYIGENIRIYRERLNLTQQQLADRIDKTWEMISRYERGVSSPLNQIDELAKALNTTPSNLIKDNVDIEFRFGKVPLFTSIPKGVSFSKENTFTYYNSPDWVMSVDCDCFALDLQIVSKNELDFKDGIVYVSPNSKINLNDIVLVREKDNLNILRLKSFKGIDIIGKVLAQEIRY